MGRKGSEVSPSNRYPLRSAHSSGRVLRSTAANDNKDREPLNGAVATQAAVKKRSGSQLDSRNSSVRLLRSTSKNKDEARSGPLNDRIPDKPAANKRKHASPSQVGNPSNSFRVLRSAIKNKDEACSEPVSDRIAGEPAANKRKNVKPSKVGSPSSGVRVLRSGSKAKDETCTKPLNDSTAVKPASSKRKGTSPSKVGSPSNSVRVLRSTSKYENETCTGPLNDSGAVEPAANKRKGVSRSKEVSSNSSIRVLRSASNNKIEVSTDPLNNSTAGQPAAKRRKTGSSFEAGSPARSASARVLRSTSERKNEASSEPLNDSTSAQPSSRKRKGGAISNNDTPKIGVRVLRSASGKNNKAYNEPVNDSTSAEPTVTKRRIHKPSKDRSPKKDYLKICQRVRYILKRMNYQQTFIQAYASEGWKGQSLEKIRPEKELERAKEEILQCKLRIREAFRNMDSILSEGKLEESLFDSAGEISSEDIFCAVCGSKDVTLQNDIILCDGACDRGFHQNCLNPPLLTEDIPPGDKGWFCPACVCKADSIDALNELQGSKLSIYDSWEKVFPEAASIANDSKQVDTSDLLPDRINDSDNLALAEGHMANEVRFSAEDDNEADDLGLPSEDSGDDDFDPEGPDSSDQKDGLNAEESDFTSDSDDFCVEIAKSCGQDEVSESPLSNVINRTDRMKLRAPDNHAFMDMVLPVSSRRQVERLDYKKLYDEAYGKDSSNSSDDEEWSGKELLEGSETDSFERGHPVKRCSRRAPAGQQNNEHTPQREWLHGSESEQKTEIPRSNGSSSTGRKFDPVVTQKLKVHFEKDPYPSRETKANLSEELGLTFNQVSRWFSTARHYSRVVSAKKEMHHDNHTSVNNDSTIVDSMQATQPSAGMMEKLTRNRNDIVPEKPMVQNNLNQGVMEKLITDRNDIVPEEPVVQSNLNQSNIEDIPLSGTEIEMESYGQESSDSSDEEWSAFSTPRKTRLQDNEKASLSESLCSTKRCSRRPAAREQNNEHTQSEQLHGSTSEQQTREQLHGSASEQQTEVLRSNVSSAKASKYHFGPVVRQKLKEHFEKDPYPCRATKESLAQELGLTFNQISKWFSATRHYSRDAVAKNQKHPVQNTTENNNIATFDGTQVIEPNFGLIDKPAANINDMISEKLMVQINLNEGIEEDIPHSQYTRCEEKVTMTPAVISREAGPPGYGPGENFHQASSKNTSCEQSAIIAPNAIAREVSPPRYAPGDNQGSGAPWNTSCERRLFMSPADCSKEVDPPGYGPEENRGSGISWNTSSEQILFMSPATISRELGPPGYGPIENQLNGTSLNTTNCESGAFLSPVITSREDGPPGYGPGENQENDSTSCELRMFTSPTTISREVGPPGYELIGKNKGNGGASWSTNYQQGVFTSPKTISREACPPVFGAGDNQGNDTPWYMNSKQRAFTSPTTISREVGPPGNVQENQGNGASWNTSYEQGVFMSPTDISREVGPPGYWPGENQGNITSWISTYNTQRMFSGPSTISNTSYEQGVFMSPTDISKGITSYEQGVFMSPTDISRGIREKKDISREVGPPGYGPGENQGNITSWISTYNTQRMFTCPSTISSEVGLPGRSPVGIQGTGGSRSMNLEAFPPGYGTCGSRSMDLEAFPPGYGPGENQCSDASGVVISPQGRPAESAKFSDEARKKAIQRELRRRQKFR